MTTTTMTMVGSAREAGPWMVGIQRNDYFTGREALLEALHRELVRSGHAALSGLGGVGKTQIAAEYAYRYRAEYRAVFWLNAADPSSAACSLMQIAELLGLCEHHPQDEQAAVDAALRYLEETDDWLIVYDSADEPDFLKEYMPRLRAGHTVVTTRAQVLDSLGIANPIEISPMTPAEALSFMLRRTGRESAGGAELASAETLVQKLGYLPLALEQAAAFVAGKQSRFQAYLEAYDGQSLELLERARPVAGDPEKSVTTTWIIAFESLESTPVAADILAMSAFLAAEEIPLELLQYGASELGPHIAASLGELRNELRLDEALEPLTRYSLIHRNIVGRTFTVHRLVQEVARNRMTPEERCYWSECVIRAMNRVFASAGFEAWNLCERLVPHVRQIAACIAEDVSPSMEAASLFGNAGKYLFRHGQYVEAEPLCRRAATIYEKAAGVSHPDYARSLNELACLLRFRHKDDEAQKFHRRSMEIVQQALGEESAAVKKMRDDFMQAAPRNGRTREKAELTRREREVASHVAQGRSNRAIADALSLSERTVESHVASILAKRRMSSRGEIAAYVLREPNSVSPA